VANVTKSEFLARLEAKFGTLDKLANSQSLFQLHGYDVRLYVRYSKIHPGGRTFFGLRETDLRHLQGFESFIAFLWDNQTEPLFLPLRDYQELFQETTPAADGQYKVQILQAGGSAPELYIAQLGRFNVSGHLGWQQLADTFVRADGTALPKLSHSQVQTLLGAIGVAVGHDVWIPVNDRLKLDWSLTQKFEPRILAPTGFKGADRTVSDIDVLWLGHGTNEPKAAFEVEHSTTIYSGLLRFNDLHLALPALHPTFSIVADDVRRSTFARQLQRPTFQISGLSEHCTFLDYGNVFNWHSRVLGKK
jgi:hypothetical protein